MDPITIREPVFPLGQAFNQGAEEISLNWMELGIASTLLVINMLVSLLTTGTCQAAYHQLFSYGDSAHSAGSGTEANL